YSRLVLLLLPLTHTLYHPASPLLFLTIRPPPRSPPFPYTTLFRSHAGATPAHGQGPAREGRRGRRVDRRGEPDDRDPAARAAPRSEEHTSELQSLTNLVCRLLLEKKNILLKAANARLRTPAQRLNA